MPLGWKNGGERVHEISIDGGDGSAGRGLYARCRCAGFRGAQSRGAHSGVAGFRGARFRRAGLSLPALFAPASDPVDTQAPEGSPVAGEGTPLLPDPSADGTIGDTITLTDFFEEDQANLTVLEAIQRPPSSTSGGPEYAFLVEIEGLTDSIHYNLVQFSMFDDENFEYQAQDGLQQPELAFGDLAKGRKVRGWLTFVGRRVGVSGAPMGRDHQRARLRASPTAVGERRGLR